MSEVEEAGVPDEEAPPEEAGVPRRRSLLSGRETLLVRALAVLSGAAGVLNVLAVILPSVGDPLRHRLFPVALEIRDTAHLATLLTGLALVALASGLWRRKRVAWALAVVALGISASSHLIRSLEYEQALLSAALALVLALLEPHFHARSDPPSILQGVRVLVGSLVLTTAYGVLGFYVMDHHFGQQFSLSQAAEKVLAMFWAVPEPDLPPGGPVVDAFENSIYGLGAATLLYSLWMVLRPVLVRVRATPDERRRARDVVEAYGRTTLARFTLFEDKSYFFTSGGSVVAYVVQGRIALALGDPIGPAADLPAALAEFRRHCEGNDWQPAFYQVLPDALEAYREAGFGVACVGQEAIVPLGEWSLAGKAGRSLRTVKNRLERLGYRAEVLRPPHPDEVMAELRSISDEWLSMMKGQEKQFSLGWFDEAYLQECPVMVVRNPSGAVDAFANILSEYQRNEATIDLMRRRSVTETGTMDYLFASLFEWAKDKGYDSFNLGLSALAGVGESPGDPSLERGLHYLYEHLNRFYNFKGLHQFKEKFKPEWSPRYLAYPSAALLPAVGLALVRADSGDSLLTETPLRLPWRR